MDHDRDPEHSLERDAGTTIVEYGLMMALIALVAFAAITVFGMSVNDLFDNTSMLDALS